MCSAYTEMHRSAGTWQTKYGGLAVAGVGFGLTRYTVLDSVREGEALGRFLVGQAPFLVLGLSLTAFGVALAVSTYTRRQVHVVAAWCLLGTGAMAAVLGLTHAETALFGGAGTGAGGSDDLVANVLIGGAVGGVLVGVRSAANRRHRRELATHTNRLTVLNRILRHEVLNKLNVIRGYATLDARAAESADALDAIRRNAERVEAAMADVTPLTRSAAHATGLEPVALDEVVERAAATTREAYPNATVRVPADLPRVTVLADDHLVTVFEHLLDNAVAYNDSATPVVTVDVDVRHASVAVRIADDGPGLPDAQQSLLREGRLPEYDDPTAGFGLAVSQLLVDLYGGDVRVETGVDGNRGTALTLAFARPSANGGRTDGEYGVSGARLLDATASALVAGVVMGGLLQVLFGSIAIIGALYGVASAAVAWTTHLFHSVVFGFVFAAAVWRRQFGRDWRSVARCAGAGVAYGAVLWLVASGFVMPLWLRAVGTPAPVPNLGAVNLFGHLVWGAVLGGLYARLQWRDGTGRTRR